MNFPALAFKNQNDFYDEGAEKELTASNGPILKSLQKRLQRADRNSRLRDEKAVLLVAILFKTNPSESCKASLKQDGFFFEELTRNPYAKADL